MIIHLEKVDLITKDRGASTFEISKGGLPYKQMEIK